MSSQVDGKIKFRIKSFLEIDERALHHVILVQSACDLLSKLETVLKVLSFQSTVMQECVGKSCL